MTSKMTKSHIFTSFVLAFLATVSSANADGGKCEMLLPQDGRSIVYSCVEATLDHLQSIPSEAEWIQFSVSKLPNIPKGAFSRFNLRRLSFYNCDVRHIDPEAFEGLVNLRWLTFYGLTVNVIRASWFKGLTSLTHLSMENNQIMYIEPTVFLRIPNLEYLNIENNELSCLPYHALTPLRKLRNMRTRKNPWLCNCYMELVVWMANRQINMGAKDALSKFKYECMEDFGPRSSISELHTYKWTALSSEEYQKMYKNASSSQTEYVSLSSTELSRIPDNTESINFERTKIRMIEDFAFFRFGNSLRSLNFSSCSINQIEPEAFVGLSKLEQLVLFNNSINEVKSEWFKDLYGLKELVLDGNSITHIPQSLFQSLGNIETLSLNGNKIQCLSTDSFSFLKKLKRVNIEDNPWVCNCQKEFRAWLDKKQIGYKMSTGKCTNEKIEKNLHRSETEYESGVNEHKSGSVVTEIKNQEAETTHGSVIQSNEGFPTHFGNYHEEQNEEIAKNEAQHEQNKKITSYEHYLNITERQQQQSEYKMQQQHSQKTMQQQQSEYKMQQQHSQQTMQQQQQQELIQPQSQQTIQMQEHREQNWKTHNWEYKPRPQTGCTALGTDLDSVTEISRKDFGPPGDCRIVKSRWSFVRRSYLCSDATLSNLSRIPEQAESITVQNSVIPHLLDNTFARFGGNLRVLELINCSIQHITPRAFAGLVNLQELNLNLNYITEVRTSWFEAMPSLRRLSLSCNHIQRVENGVFFLLKKLEYLEIRNNRLNSIGTESVSSMSSMRVMAIDNNPWSCLNLHKLVEWMDSRDIYYDKNRLKLGSHWDCIGSSTVYSRDGSNVTTGGIPGSTSTTSPTLPPLPPPPPHSLRSYRCTFDLNSQYGINSRECVGGDLHVLEEIPSNAERIKITNAMIPQLPADAFARFTNLRELLFYNCSIEDIDQFAFRGLRKLQLLTLVDNRIPIVRSAWFSELNALTKLQLARNSVTEIEADTFSHLQNLQELSLKDNKIDCIYTESLSPLKNLKVASFEENPWKWGCLKGLEDFVQRRNVSATKFDTYHGRVINCGICYTKEGTAVPITNSKGTTNTSISAVNVICVSIAMLIFTKF
ncbi:slit homolog 1 protein-like [Neodiprion pinetum]|uniref:slit homolog 1 protein-like n=1 Tax=Neodiprion pinetum TaxID=441929 RepID=UPI001EDED6FA|nr:slit homolog 2 protein-like [Neodiprion pinetum]XP_046473490.1 slit homolog 2 protein-like [Neodiprion pinetum]XP_046473491.1 slit homolog 2 protein-like [Neodiprion pinetum]XP_046473492.1 slit homolog 2 protein-like [Neodiprion pinetum]